MYVLMLAIGLRNFRVGDLSPHHAWYDARGVVKMHLDLLQTVPRTIGY
jgi:hypothetical protein